MLRQVVLIYFFLFTCSVCFSQTVNKLHVFVDKESQIPVPFVEVKTKKGTLFSNIKGEVKLDSLSIIEISHPIYLSIAKIVSSSDTTELTPIDINEKVSFTPPPSYELIEKVIANKKINEPKSHAPYSYKSYNKFYINTNKTTDTKQYLEKLLNPFSFTFKDFQGNHYLVLSESITERVYKEDLKEEEVITSSRISGVDRPLLLSLNSQVQSFSFYGDYIRISGKDYLSPLEDGGLKRYNFKIVHTSIALDGNIVYTVLFYPKKNKRFESLRGVLYINSNGYALQYALMQPAKETKTTAQIAHSSTLTKNGWFPESSVTTVVLDNLGNGEMQFSAVAESHIYDLESHTSIGNKTFNDVAVYYDESKVNDTTLLSNERLYALSEKEEKTYTLYDTIGHLNNFTRAINFGEKLYYKQIPYKNFNLELKHLLDVNDYVGVQIGGGVSTNDKFSEIFSVGGYMEYGFKDKESKFGFNGAITAPWERKLALQTSFSKDITEAGGLPTFFQHRNMYNTEWLRKLRLNRFDKNVTFDIGIESNPINYVFVRTSITTEHSKPAYEYSYSADSLTTFNYTDLYIGIKIAYGERFFKLLKERISLGRPLPVLWLELTRGVTGLNGDFEYRKLYSKIEYKYPIPGIGTLGIQVSAGKVWGSLPYGRLYNGKGSLGVRTVAHNSFETMSYNEFLSSQYLTFFLSHDFGYMNYLEYKNFRPRFEVALNMGFGSLSNDSEHNSITYKTMEKGYFEIGAMANNLLSINISPVKMGLGIGFFHRIGAYRLDSFSDNTFFKLATTFKL